MKKYIHIHRRSDDDDDDDDNNNVMQGLKAKLFLVLYITKGKKRTRHHLLVFFLATIHKIEEKGRIGRTYRPMCIYTHISRLMCKSVCVRVHNSLAISWYL